MSQELSVLDFEVLLDRLTVRLSDRLHEMVAEAVEENNESLDDKLRDEVPGHLENAIQYAIDHDCRTYQVLVEAVAEKVLDDVTGNVRDRLTEDAHFISEIARQAYDNIKEAE